MSPTQKRLFTWGRRLSLVLAVAVVVALLFHRLLLAGFARAWEIDEPLPERADAALLPGGGVETRTFVAADLHRRGVVPKILVCRPELTEASRLGVAPPDHEITRSMLGRLGVPDRDLVWIGDAVTSTWEEVEALRAWQDRRGSSGADVIVVSDLFPSRRLARLFRKHRKPGTEVTIVTAPPKEYDHTDWWTCEEGLIACNNELIKWAYYWVKY